MVHTRSKAQSAETPSPSSVSCALPRFQLVRPVLILFTQAIGWGARQALGGSSAPGNRSGEASSRLTSSSCAPPKPEAALAATCCSERFIHTYNHDWDSPHLTVGSPIRPDDRYQFRSEWCCAGQAQERNDKVRPRHGRDGKHPPPSTPQHGLMSKHGPRPVLTPPAGSRPPRSPRRSSTRCPACASRRSPS